MLGRFRRRRPQPLVGTLFVEYGEFCVEKTSTTTRMAREIHDNAQKIAEEASIVGPGNLENPQTDTDGLFSLTSVLKACTKRKDLRTGSKLYADIVARGLLEKDVFIGGTLVNMYAKCGDLVKAQEVFDDLPVQNVVSWTALIAGYAQHGHGEEALHYFGCMQREGFPPDAVTFACILKACGSIAAVDQGCKIHGHIVRDGLLKEDIVVGTALVDMYAKCGLLRKAQEVFDELPLRNLVSWNVLITGFAQHGRVEEALHCFQEMQGEGFSPDTVTYAGILKAFGSTGAVIKGQELHAQIMKHGLLEEDIVVGNALVDMYAKCGALAEAHEVFDDLPCRNVVSWTALIAGYAQHGHGEEAFNGFERMQHEGLSPDHITFACILKVCGNIAAADKGQEIHVQLVREGLLGKDIIVGTALVEMYAKCGMFGNAREAFIELRVQNIVLWNVLIGGYAQHGHGEEALKCFDRMQCEGLFPDAATFACIFKACGSIEAAKKGQEKHAQIVKYVTLEDNLVVVSALIDMYAKCNLFKKAQMMFDNYQARNLAMWNALIVGYAQHGHVEEALGCFKQMQQEGVFPDSVTLACAFKVCGSMGIADKGREFHVQIVRDHLTEKDTVVANALVDMYVKCNALSKAQEVFDEITARNVGSWNAMIAGYSQLGHVEDAVSNYKRMLCEATLADAVTFAGIFKACGIIGVPDKGQEIHAQIIGDRLLERDMVACTALVDMYARCGQFGKAKTVFDRLPVRDAVSWNALLAAYVQHEHGEDALICLEQMQHEGFCPDGVTFLCILKACSSTGAIVKGQEIHAEIVRQGLLKADVAVGNAVVDMYAKCGLVGRAQEVFNELPVRSLVSWNVLISGYVQHVRSVEAFSCFECMQHEGHQPDRVTFLNMLKAYGSMGAAEYGQEMHSAIVKAGSFESDFVVGTALVDMYAKCGMLAEAQEVFNKLPNWDVVSWNALVIAYVQHMHDEEALKLFELMQLVGFFPDAITFVCILKACGSVGAAYKGQEIHVAIAREGLLESDMVVGNAVIDMYANCGMLAEAQNVFDKLPGRDIVSWNAVISGYALLGKDEVVFGLLDEMIEECEVPDLITFTLVLNTCSHRGLLDEGQMYFETMGTSYGIVPDREHYSCMVDLFGRAGQLDKAAEVIKQMPLSASLTMWHSVLGACRKWDNMELGQWAFEHAVRLDELDAGAYVCMRNIYAAVGRQEEADAIDALRVQTCEKAQQKEHSQGHKLTLIQ